MLEGSVIVSLLTVIAMGKVLLELFKYIIFSLDIPSHVFFRSLIS